MQRTEGLPAGSGVQATSQDRALDLAVDVSLGVETEHIRTRTVDSPRRTEMETVVETRTAVAVTTPVASCVETCPTTVKVHEVCHSLLSPNYNRDFFQE